MVRSRTITNQLICYNLSCDRSQYVEFLSLLIFLNMMKGLLSQSSMIDTLHFSRFVRITTMLWAPYECSLILYRITCLFCFTYFEQEFDRMWSVVDQNGDGVLDYGEFTRSFIGTMSEFRKYFVRKVLLKIPLRNQPRSACMKLTWRKLAVRVPFCRKLTSAFLNGIDIQTTNFSFKM